MTQCLPRIGFLNAKSKKLMFQDSAYPHPPTKKICHCILSLVTLVTDLDYLGLFGTVYKIFSGTGWDYLELYVIIL